MGVIKAKTWANSLNFSFNVVSVTLLETALASEAVYISRALLLQINILNCFLLLQHAYTTIRAKHRNGIENGAGIDFLFLLIKIFHYVFCNF